ncbi:hypothetical protein NDU88_006797 [Pleurodeles waltl]|uniref:Uncharacterized protein n=1 Tax=Pleurodeles waltl TaxID=8319 RepID=A0AAV7WYK8_PLEWA|nr:hypothetical protein NDU88_006797 [Pleurodeles waltl]
MRSAVLGAQASGPGLSADWRGIGPVNASSGSTAELLVVVELVARNRSLRAHGAGGTGSSGRAVERNPPVSKSKRGRVSRGCRQNSVTAEAAAHAPDLEQLIQEQREALQSAAAISTSPGVLESETELSQPPSDRPATPDRLSELGFPECLTVTPATADNLF